MQVYLRRMWIQLTADKKRFGLLLVMMSLGLLMWARIIIVSNPPRRAMAGNEEEEKLAQLRDGQHSSDSLPLPERIVRLAEAPDRNPFDINSDYFPEPTIDQDESEDREKSGSRTADDPRQAELLRRRALRRVVDQFKLEAVMKGSPMIAVINGRSYRPDDVVRVSGSEAGFVLTEIKTRSVILEAEGFRFELQMPLISEGSR